MRPVARLGVLLGALALLVPARLSPQTPDGQTPPLPKQALVAGAPYVRQSHPNTCGAAALAMLFKWAGVDLGEARILDACPQMKETGFWIPWLWELAGKQGLRFECGEGDPTIVKRWLAKGHPVIVYQYSTEATRRPHLRVVIGYDDGENTFIVHDPAKELGPNHRIAYPLFEKLWQLPYYSDENGEKKRFYFVLTSKAEPRPGAPAQSHDR